MRIHTSENVGHGNGTHTAQIIRRKLRLTRSGRARKTLGWSARRKLNEQVSVWTEDVLIATYLPAPPDRNPMFLEKRVYQGSSGKVYPLPFTDRVAEKPVERRWKAVWLENEFIRVMVLPEVGGRIHLLQDKTNGYDLIYRQPVIKPALVGLAGPWLSGGIEFNWPQHHRPATFLPVDIEIEEHADGSKTIWCSDHEPMARMKGMHGVCLRPGRAYLELKVRAYNRTPFVQTFLWWANVATRVHEAYQSFFPPDVYYVADHARRSMSEYPLCQGQYYGVRYAERGRKGVPESEIPGQFVPPHCRKSQNSNLNPEVPAYTPNDLSFYANIPVPTSYMCMGSTQNFFGGYDYAAQAGLVHYANHHISPGKKQWTWGNHEFGYAWDRNLTDANAQGEFAPYIEIMAGVYTDNQPDFSFLQPGETKSWSQYWYPIQKIGPARHANLDAAVSLQFDKKQIGIGVAVTRAFPGAVVRLERNGSGVEWDAELRPGRPFIVESRLPRRPWQVGETTLRVLDRKGREIISCQPKSRARAQVPPPATEPPAPEDITSADELYLTGLHLEQYRHATRSPTLYWREALRRDPLDARCNNALGAWHLRRGEFTAAEARFRKAIERLTLRNANPHDGEAYYNLGLCLRYLDRDDEAYDAFYKATWNQAWAGAGYHALAEIDCARRDWNDALGHLEHSLRFDTDNLRARNLKVLVLRKVGQASEAAALLNETLRLDPLDWWARNLDSQRLTCDLQTHLDIAHDYARAGLYAEAIELLVTAAAPVAQVSEPAVSPISNRQRAQKDGPLRLVEASAGGKGCDTAGFEKCVTAEHHLPTLDLGALPMIHYTLGWLEGRRRNHSQALTHFQHAAKLPPDYCFPARLEELGVLETAMRVHPGDPRAPYYLGNLLYDRRRHEEAIRLWERSARLDPKFSVVWRNLGIGYFNIRKQPGKARAAYGRACRSNPKDARLLFERDQLWKRLGEKPQRRLGELSKRLNLVQQRDDLSIELCALYNQTGQHDKAARLVGSRRFQPWEGGEGGPLGQHVSSQLALGRAALAKRDFAAARAHFERALTSPHNLSEAKHLLANQSDIYYWLGCACAAEGDANAARRCWSAAANFKGDFQGMSVRAFSEMTYYSAKSREKLGQQGKARELFRDLLAYARQLQRQPAKIDYFATSLPTMLLFDDDIHIRQGTTAIFLQAQAELGLGRKAEARALLKTVLRRDPNHALAADFMREMKP
jgi:tetratricopeptide (TPR) repeat protein